VSVLRAPDRELLRTAPPRLGFLGTGWIGRNRLEAVARDGVAEVAAYADPSPECAALAAAAAPGARACSGLEELLDQQLDGIVIATPSALHAAQCLQALGRGVAVFCQKPLGRTEPETRSVVEAARRADLLLGVDFCYRSVAGMEAVRRLVQEGSLGRVFAVDATFHNAYGPDKAWFFDPALSGGGCVMDLGIHLVDLAGWVLGFPPVQSMRSRLFARGERLGPRRDRVEDCAIVEADLGGTALRLACSWNLNAGQDAVIALEIYGTEGGAALRNERGSFYDFTVERFRGTSRELLASPPDAWPGRTIAAWARRLAAGARFDPEAERLVDVAAVIDAIYRAEAGSST
jgi:predicted dehydrogenase